MRLLTPKALFAKLLTDAIKKPKPAKKTLLVLDVGEEHMGYSIVYPNEARFMLPIAARGAFRRKKDDAALVKDLLERVKGANAMGILFGYPHGYPKMEASVDKLITVLHGAEGFDEFFYSTINEAASSSKADSKLESLAKKGQDVKVPDAEEDPPSQKEKKDMLSSYFLGRDLEEEGKKAYRGRKA